MAANPVELDRAVHQHFPNLLRNLLRNPVCSAPKPPGTFSGTFSGEPSPEPSSWPHSSSQPKPPRPSPEFFSGTLLSSAPKPPRPSPELFPVLRNLLRNPVEAELALHQGLLEPSLDLTWLCTKASQTFSRTFSGTFSGTLLNVTWLCTKTSQTFSRTFGTFSGTPLNLTRCLQQCTPELFWAEEPNSWRCWGKMGRETHAACTCENTFFCSLKYQ